MRRLALLAVLFTAIAPLTALDVGQPAPALDKVTWLKGSPVATGSVVTVVEFWATWCGPCRQTIPHLSELQRKYGDRVHIAGLSNEDRPTVAPFIGQMGETMDYHVGLVDEATHKAYMDGVDGIPHAFLIDASGTVVWQGHPATLAAPLDQVVTGKFDAKRAKDIAKVEAQLQEILGQQQPDIAKALAKVDEILALDPLHEQAISVRLAIGKFTKDQSVIRDTLTRLPMKDLSPAFANSLAWSRVTEEDLPSRHLDLALGLVDHALAGEPGHAGFLDTKARLLSELGLIDQAIRTQEQAVAAAPGKDNLAANLAYYRSLKDMAAKLGAGPTPAVAPKAAPVVP
jgi:thiol-disulfide isomerase/thioredoxin